MRIADASDAIEIYNLMKKVYDNLADKSLFFCDDLEYVREHISDRGFAVKVEQNGILAASLIVRFPYGDSDNLGRDVGMEDEELCNVAHLESIVVDEKFRGRELQNEMIRYAQKIIVEKGFVHLMATVSPDNSYSLRNFEKNGYVIMKVKEKYGGLKRAILYKKIENRK